MPLNVRWTYRYDLLHVRPFTQAPALRYLWLVSVCITSVDGSERNVQTEVMGRVFATANSILYALMELHIGPCGLSAMRGKY